MTTFTPGKTDQRTWAEIFNELKKPFKSSEIEWRAGATDNKDNPTRAIALAYTTSRAVMNRLDEVLGPENWRDEYVPGPQGGVLCRLSVRLPGMMYEDGWITKEDGAENTEIEEIKGGISDAFKRAAVKWGIGRYLYGLDSEWVPCQKRGRSVVLSTTPNLPDWALPPEEQGKAQDKPQNASQGRSAVNKKVAEATDGKAKPVYPWKAEFQTLKEKHPDIEAEIFEEVIGTEVSWASIDDWLRVSEDHTLEALFEEAVWYKRALAETEASNE